MMKRYELSAYLQRFFTERLGQQMKASPNTVASYRDTFRLLLRYASDQRKKEPTALQVADIDAVTELVTLTCADVALGANAHVRCLGKGRKERATPVRKDSVKLLRNWLAERKGQPIEPLFISNRGTSLSRDAVEGIVRSTLRRPRRCARHCRRSASHRTCSDTARPCSSCTAASIAL